MGVTAHPSAEEQQERRWAERRDLNRGFGDALAQAFEFAAVPLLFAAFGWWLDDRPYAGGDATGRIDGFPGHS